MKYLFLILLLIPQICFANNYQIAANSTLFVDWMQTREIARNPDYQEMNPILGSNPSQNEVNKYFITSIAITNLIGGALPKKYSDMFYIGVSGFESAVILHNYKIGVRIKF